MQPSQLEVNLPGTQSANEDTPRPETVRIRIGRDGNYAMGTQGVLNEVQLRSALVKAFSSKKNAQERLAIVEADAAATHQSVVLVMDMLAGLGVTRVSIATAGGKAP